MSAKTFSSRAAAFTFRGDFGIEPARAREIRHLTHGSTVTLDNGKRAVAHYAVVFDNPLIRHREADYKLGYTTRIVPVDTNPEIREWIEENLTGGYYIASLGVFFVEHDDAVLCLMMFSS